MAKLCENLQLCCGILRIGCYTLFCKKMCCRADPLPKHEFSVICIGLANTGKSTLLALLSGESVEGIEPTTGFSIKALRFENCILNVKELGGGDNVRQYWKHYLDDTQGVIFVVDSSDDEVTIKEAASDLGNILRAESLAGLPCLILASCQDKPNARSTEEVSNMMDLSQLCAGRQWVLHAGSTKDVASIKEGFEKFNFLLLSQLTEDAEDDQSPPSAESANMV